MYKVGFIGLGAMGRGICHNIIEAGNEVRVFDLSQEAMDLFAGQATPCASAAEAAEGAEVVFMSLPNSRIVEATVDELIAQGVEGTLVVDLSTSDPTSTRALHDRLVEAGGNLVDSPLMAAPEDAWNKESNIFVGGDKEVVDAHADLFDMYSCHWDYAGPSGNGHLVKLAQNWAGLGQAFMYAQIFPVIQKYGIEPDVLFKLMKNPTFDNWFFDFYGHKYVEKNYRMDFSLDLALKDFMYIKKLSDELNIPGFMVDGAIDLCRVTLKEAAEVGKGKVDCSSVADTMYRYCED